MVKFFYLITVKVKSQMFFLFFFTEQFTKETENLIFHGYLVKENGYEITPLGINYSISFPFFLCNELLFEL